MKIPLISIITPSSNRAGYIAQALESVFRQDYPQVEHIIVDNNSTDGTLEILAEWSHIKTINGPDHGMYDALNKGLKAANGEIIGFLNTDDLYVEGTLSKVVDLFTKTNVDAVAGQAIYFLENDDKSTSFFRPSTLITRQNLWQEIIYGDPAFNAWFFHRRVFEQIRNFNTAYQIAGDRDFLMRFALNNFSYANLRKVVYRYRVHADSLSLSTDLLKFSRVADENLKLASNYWNLVPENVCVNFRKVRTRDTITAASRDLRAGAYREAMHYMQIGCRYDLLWPIKFFWRLFTGIFRAAGRKLGFYPPI